MGADVRLLVVTHADVEGERHRRDAAPFGRPAGPGPVEIAEVDRAVHHQIPATAGGQLALAGTDPGPGAIPDVPHRAAIVVPAARLLEIEKVVVFDQPD